MHYYYNFLLSIWFFCKIKYLFNLSSTRATLCGVYGESFFYLVKISLPIKWWPKQNKRRLFSPWFYHVKLRSVLRIKFFSGKNLRSEIWLRFQNLGNRLSAFWREQESCCVVPSVWKIRKQEISRETRPPSLATTLAWISLTDLWVLVSSSSYNTVCA